MKSGAIRKNLARLWREKGNRATFVARKVIAP
jgi:hypothetical protein